jgi:excisionase family DNA binding protein
MEKLLKPEEVAELLSIQLSTVYNWTYSGKRGYRKIPYLKVGSCLRFKASDIEKWLNEPKEPTEKPKPERPKAGKGLMKRKKDSYIDSLVEKAKREVLV